MVFRWERPGVLVATLAASCRSLESSMITREGIIQPNHRRGRRPLMVDQLWRACCLLSCVLVVIGLLLRQHAFEHCEQLFVRVSMV